MYMIKNKIYLSEMKTVLFLVLLICFSQGGYAGNQDRSGQAGAPELLINPWSRSTGWESANAAGVRGVESMFLNVGGLSFVKKTEINFTHTVWLAGSQISINTFGLAQRTGKKSVVGLSVMSMNLGDIMITKVDQPDGGLGKFTPHFMNINLAYSREFSHSIYGGFNIKVIQEAIPDLKAQGIAIDAGIQYVTGKKENIKFGVSLKNVGPRLLFTGNGLAYRGTITGTSNSMTLQQRSSELELPSLIKISAAYDFEIDKEKVHMLTAAFTFTSNSFTRDQFSAGLEYGFRSVLFLRAGYTYEKGMYSSDSRTSAFTGPSAGLSVDIPMNREKHKKFSFDYSYRATNPFAGTHSFGIQLTL